jgi:hypothetical protein
MTGAVAMKLNAGAKKGIEVGDDAQLNSIVKRIRAYIGRCDNRIEAQCSTGSRINVAHFLEVGDIIDNYVLY